MRQEDSVRQETSPPPAVLVTFAAAILAGIAGAVASGAMAWIAVGAVALGGAYFASRTASPRKTMVDVGRPRRLLLLLDRGGSTDGKVPLEFTGEWGALYERVNRLALGARSQTPPTPGSELDQFRKHAELAASLLRDGKDPLAEAPELRAGPLQSLLEGMKSASSLPVVSHLALGEEGLIGEDGDTLPPDWPKPTGEGVAHVSGGGGVGIAVENGLRELIREIEALRTTLGGARNGEAPPANEDAPRTPAQLVDAVVLTAADGIEDLAAGLMRANELASVAERVTNRATLLALNAALEATRSGSEAFAAIAEETRRLAEFAREATDTISRLSSEIEYKVGETITAIHATSEDAKTSLAGMSGSTVPVPSSARSARVQVVRLLDRSRQLLNSLGAPAPQAQVGTEPSSKQKSAEELVENGPPSADNLPMEGILLIEGLKPGARLES
jgi:hypothetical protein